MGRRHGKPRAIGDILGPALRGLGMPSARLTQRVLTAWQQVADPAWREKAQPVQLEGGVLVIAVSSAALREELAQFHRARLLDVLKTALPDLPLIGIRFTLAEAGFDSRTGSSGDDR